MQIVFIWWDRFRDSNTGAEQFLFHFLLICNAASWAWFVDGLRCVGDILGAIRVMVFILNRTGMFAREGLRRQRNGVLPARISLSSSSFFPYFWVKPNAKRETYFRKCSAERLGSIWLRHRRMRMKNVQAVNGRRAVFFFFCVCVVNSWMRMWLTVLEALTSSNKRYVRYRVMLSTLKSLQQQG